MKMTVFSRILAATILPVMLVLIIIIGTARTVIYRDGVTYTREFIRVVAEQISEQIEARIENIDFIQNDIINEMINTDFARPDAKHMTEELLEKFLLSNNSPYSAWFVFEPGVFPGDGRYYKSVIRAGDGAVESGRILNDPETSPWHNIPLSTGQPYADIDTYCDFMTGEGSIHVFIMSHPIIAQDGRIIGSLGLAIRYEDLFIVNKLIHQDIKSVMLVSTDGDILYSMDKDNAGRLWDYGFKDAEAVMRTMNDRSVWQEEIVSPFTGEKLIACLYPIKIDSTGQTVYLCWGTLVSSLYGTLYSSMKIIIITGVLGMILLILSVSFSTRGIVRHIRRITDSFNRVATESAVGTLEGEHIPIENINVVELDMLQSALISMMVQLRKVHEMRLKAVEAEVEKNRLIASAEAKMNFFATMSHEIRTPMNAILGISKIMLYNGSLTPQQERYMQDIKISTDALLNIINDILDISKLETGNIELLQENYNFRALIGNIVSLSTHLAAEANLRFAFEQDKELPLCLYGDGTYLRQILLNLIGNAVKFTRKGHVLLRISFQGDTMRFEVSDSGIGIKESELESIFESFKRVDTRRNREIKGTGLGLSINKKLVELMGGTITVESVYGAGTVFRVTLPVVLGDETKMRRAELVTNARYSESLRVLVVDDDKTNLNVSSGLLKAAHGILCDTAGSGYEAIEKVQINDYDIIFMDHMMPELDGLDTTRRIRQLGGEYRNIPIIALTANAVVGTREELINGGMNDFLTKPIQSDKLQEILNTWVPPEKRIPDYEAYAKDSSAKTSNMDFKFSGYPYLREQLEEIGIDIIAGLENIGFDEDMYLKSLRIFKEKLLSTTQLLWDLLEQENMRKFYAHVHGLKGSLDSIGATALFEDTTMLEEASLEDSVNDCRAVFVPLTQNLQRLHEALSQTLPDEESFEGNADFDEEKLNISLKRLCSALEDYDYEAVTGELNTVLSMKHNPVMSESISRLKLLIDSFDYTRAVLLIQNEIMQTGDDLKATKPIL